MFQINKSKFVKILNVDNYNFLFETFSFYYQYSLRL